MGLGASKSSVTTDTISGYSTPDCSVPDLCSASNMRLIVFVLQHRRSSFLLRESPAWSATAHVDPKEPLLHAQGRSKTRPAVNLREGRSVLRAGGIPRQSLR